MADKKHTESQESYEAKVQAEIKRRMGQRWMEHGDAVQSTPESIEEDVRSTGYWNNRAIGKLKTQRKRQILDSVMAQAKALGIDDWASLFARACEDDEVLKSLKMQ